LETCRPESLTRRSSVEPGSELLKGPYVVETFPVSVEEAFSSCAFLPASFE
jgi:hypothetical protein